MPRRLQPQVYKRVVTSGGDVSAGKVAGSLVCAKSGHYQLMKKRRVALIDLGAQLVFFLSATFPGGQPMTRLNAFANALSES